VKKGDPRDEACFRVIPSCVSIFSVLVRVKARIQVDTSILDRQIEELMKEKGIIKKLEQERQKVKDLENKLAGLKSSEIKRLDELNAQALALERERERQRLILEEQGLKARGELKKAEIDRLQKERDMQDRISQPLAEQEKAKKAEARHTLGLPVVLSGAPPIRSNYTRENLIRL
jgi:hypothetical protein